jgi:DNA polymerase-4
MDAFYASVEQRDFPEYRGKPLIVGGPPDSRGVVAACSYEARRFGIHSAMPSSRAWRLCPQAIFVKPRFDVYRTVSREIQAVFYEFTDKVEPLSLDEAYLDVSECNRWSGSATLIAKEIKSRIRLKTGLTASAGVSYNKFLAKIASDMDKPDGLYVIKPEQGEAFIEKLPIGRFFGVGRATEAKMKQLNIHTGLDLKNWSRDDLVAHFGKPGGYYYEIARGIDRRAVNSHRIRKSISK